MPTTNFSRKSRISKPLTALQERERQLIGFEIHDGFKLLTGAKLRLESFKYLEDQSPAAAKEALDSGIEALTNSIKEARGLIDDLRPPNLDGIGVVGAIGDLVQEVRNQGHCEVEFVCNVILERLPWPLENTIFRVVGERSHQCLSP